MNEAERIAASAEALLAQAEAQAMRMTGDRRIGPDDAATLLDLSPGSLKNLRADGTGPAFVRIGVGGGRVSYRIDDLAEWLETRRAA